MPVVKAGGDYTISRLHDICPQSLLIWSCPFTTCSLCLFSDRVLIRRLTELWLWTFALNAHKIQCFSRSNWLFRLVTQLFRKPSSVFWDGKWSLSGFERGQPKNGWYLLVFWWWHRWRNHLGVVEIGRNVLELALKTKVQTNEFWWRWKQQWLQLQRRRLWAYSMLDFIRNRIEKIKGKNNIPVVAHCALDGKESKQRARQSGFCVKVQA